MSGTTARATKREIRRALGPEALQVLADQEAALAEQAEAITHHSETLKDLKFEQRDHSAALAALRRSSLRQRLRWLFIGK